MKRKKEHIAQNSFTSVCVCVRACMYVKQYHIARILNDANVFIWSVYSSLSRSPLSFDRSLPLFLKLVLDSDGFVSSVFFWLFLCVAVRVLFHFIHV